jgi:TatD DNase family protein
MLLDLSDNFYYGIGGVLTFKNAKKLVEIYPKIPQNRLLIETDAPYLTPHPYRGKRNEPSYTKLVASKMAELSEVSSKEIEDITTKNALELFPKIAV